MNVAQPDPYAHIRELVNQAGSHFFRVTFLKADNTLRTLLIQQAAAKFHIKGTKPEATQKRHENNPHLLNVWSVPDKGFRAINMNTITEIVLNGQRYIVSGLRPIPKKEG